MTSATDNPPPDPNFLEQVGARLGTFSPVPAWVNWGLVWFTIVTAIGIPVVIIVWRRWGADRWAIRSRNGAEQRARKLGRDVVDAHHLSRNRPAMFFRTVQALAFLIFANVLVAIAVGMRMHLYGPEGSGQPPSEFLITGRRILSFFTFAMAYLGFFPFFLRYRQLSPLADLDKYTRKSMTRIEGLFAKAGVPDDVAAERLKLLDTYIEQVRQEEIK